MRYVLDRITMNNFKLFSNLPIIFGKSLLSVLDGPNGYGKTSVFDAIEYVLTGDIQRISNCSEVNGKLGYADNCLIRTVAGQVMKPAWVEAVFSPAEEPLSELRIKRIIKSADGRKNNPKNLKDCTHTVITVGQQESKEYSDVEIANEHIATFLGDSIHRHFDRYFYISQEDRLAFLNLTENGRMEELNYLFDTQEAEREKSNCEMAKKAFENILGKLRGQLANLKKESDDLGSDPNKAVIIPYRRLLPKTKRVCLWDTESPDIWSIEQLDKLKQAAFGMKAFLQHFNSFQEAQKNDWLAKAAQNNIFLLHYLFLLNYNDISHFTRDYEIYEEVQKICREAKLNSDNSQYENLDFERLAILLNIDYNPDIISRSISEILKCKKQMGQLNRARSELNDLRSALGHKRQEMINNDLYDLPQNSCPYCGYSWSDEQKLIEGINQIRTLLESGSIREQEIIDRESKQLQIIFQDLFSERFKQYLLENQFLCKDICKSIYQECITDQGAFRLFDDHIKRYEIPAGIYKLILSDPESWMTRVEEFNTQQLRFRRTSMSSEYVELDQKYGFSGLFSEYFDSEETVFESAVESQLQGFEEKIQYLEQQFYAYQTDRRYKLKSQMGSLNSRIKKVQSLCDGAGNLTKIYKDQIYDYRKKIVRQIRIPFYFYSGKILQNYNGGLGIVLEVVLDSTIRMRAFDRPEHDIAYTFSSGQLSAAILALTLTLNHIYADEKFRCILIDDPVQTMDDINTASLVELLRTDFSTYQFIISTHETDFSDYIRYKFEKYQIPNQSICMSDMTN